MYVTFLLEKRVFVLCNMENGGRKREEKRFVTWKMEGERGKKSQKHYSDKGNKCW